VSELVGASKMGQVFACCSGLPIIWRFTGVQSDDRCFRPLRRARIFRFWQAFKTWKRGDTNPVEQLRIDLFLIL
jgi:hypothetical protein